MHLQTGFQLNRVYPDIWRQQLLLLVSSGALACFANPHSWLYLNSTVGSISASSPEQAKAEEANSSSKEGSTPYHQDEAEFTMFCTLWDAPMWAPASTLFQLCGRQSASNQATLM